MEKINEIIQQLKNNFDLENIQNYQMLILIIYNSLFIYESKLTINDKLILFDLLDNIIYKINKQQKQNMVLNTSINDLFDLLVLNQQIKEIWVNNNENNL